MNIISRYTILASLTIICCLTAVHGNAPAGQPQLAQLSPEDQKEYELIQNRFYNSKGLLDGACWTLIHCADENERKAVEKTLDLLGVFFDSSQISRLVEAGGIKTFKDNVAGLLKNKDSVVRGFAAILLAVIGDPGYKKDIAVMLNDKPAPPEKDETVHRLFYNFDRSRAAVALGMMGASEYAPRLTELLRSSDSKDRSGAAMGLGYMGAKEHVGDIVRLLSDDDTEVQVVAIQSLAELDATDHAKDIARFTTSIGDTVEVSCYALARLNAKEQTKEISVLLADEFRKGCAAKSLALLGAKEYVKDIARLIDDEGPLVRCDALIALGILGAKEYASDIAAHLKDKEEFVRPYAAISLLLIRDQSFRNDIIQVFGPLCEDPSDRAITECFSYLVKLHPVLTERQRQLTASAVEAWKKLDPPVRLAVKVEPVKVQKPADVPSPKVQLEGKQKVIDNTDLLARVKVTAIEPCGKDGKFQESSKIIYIEVLTKGVSAKAKPTVLWEPSQTSGSTGKVELPEIGKTYESYLCECSRGADFVPASPGWGFLKDDGNREEGQAYIEHTVKAGESLYKISMSYYGTGSRARTLKIANLDSYESVIKLKPGMKLNIPTFAIKKDDKAANPQPGKGE